MLEHCEDFFRFFSFSSKASHQQQVPESFELYISTENYLALSFQSITVAYRSSFCAKRVTLRAFKAKIDCHFDVQNYSTRNWKWDSYDELGQSISLPFLNRMAEIWSPGTSFKMFGHANFQLSISCTFKVMKLLVEVKVEQDFDKNWKNSNFL